ncbi:hypothetical protein EMCRGX_G030538 [Ephydatia muelleri]
MSSVSETPMFTIEDSRAVLEAVPGNIRSSTTAKSTLEERDGEVRTLFVSGLPMDVKLREVYLLFRPYEGYEGAFLKVIGRPGKTPQPIAFVSFKTRKQAEIAMDELQGVQFDPASSQVVRLEFARTNSRLLPRHTTSPVSGYYQTSASAPHYPPVLSQHAPYHHPSQSIMGMADGSWPSVMSGPPMSLLSLFSDLDSSSYAGPSSVYCEMMHGYNPLCHIAPPPAPPPTLHNLGHPFSTPCSTLFVANLEPHQTEEELAMIFACCEGFIKAKLYTRSGPPVCFAEFRDVECATSAMEKFQGHMLASSKRNSGIRIEYAKQRMGEPQSRTPTSPTASESASPIESRTSPQPTISLSGSAYSCSIGHQFAVPCSNIIGHSSTFIASSLTTPIVCGDQA